MNLLAPADDDQGSYATNSTAKSNNNSTSLLEIAITAAAGQARVVGRSLCAYYDSNSKKPVLANRVYCASTMDLISTAFETHDSVDAVVASLCPSTTDNPIRKSGCCVREIISTMPPRHGAPAFWAKLGAACGVNLGDSTKTGYVKFCPGGNSAAQSFTARFKIKNADTICTDKVSK